jgi:4-hydroxythreonine-4-phosphate dehydrogenase
LVAITAGDVAGIGPEIIVRALLNARVQQCVVPILIGHPEIFQRAAKLFNLPVAVEAVTVNTADNASFRLAVQKVNDAGKVACWNPSDNNVLTAPLNRVSAAAGDAAFQYLSAAIRLTQQGCVDAICTAPLNKESLHLAGHHYPGHTEILAEQCGVDDFAMMLHLPESALMPWRKMIQPLNTPVSDRTPHFHGVSIAHVTLHTSIASVPELLTVESISEKITLMSDFLSGIGCDRRAIGVCALNPHGGENGLFGDEEQRVIQPAVDQCRAAIPRLTGPLPVDTLIRRAISGEFDGVIAMYHDQGHIPIKLIGFDAAINITLGLPIVRTSPTHGTAFDRAWNAATPGDASGMTEAILTAAMLAAVRKDNA